MRRNAKAATGGGGWKPLLRDGFYFVMATVIVSVAVCLA